MNKTTEEVRSNAISSKKKVNIIKHYQTLRKTSWDTKKSWTKHTEERHLKKRKTLPNLNY